MFSNRISPKSRKIYKSRYFYRRSLTSIPFWGPMLIGFCSLGLSHEVLPSSIAWSHQNLPLSSAARPPDIQSISSDTWSISSDTRSISSDTQNISSNWFLFQYFSVHKLSNWFVFQYFSVHRSPNWFLFQYFSVHKSSKWFLFQYFSVHKLSKCFVFQHVPNSNQFRRDFQIKYHYFNTRHQHLI